MMNAYTQNQQINSIKFCFDIGKEVMIEGFCFLREGTLA